MVIKELLQVIYFPHVYEGAKYMNMLDRGHLIISNNFTGRVKYMDTFELLCEEMLSSLSRRTSQGLSKHPSQLLILSTAPQVGHTGHAAPGFSFLGNNLQIDCIRLQVHHQLFTICRFSIPLG